NASRCFGNNLVGNEVIAFFNFFRLSIIEHDDVDTRFNSFDDLFFCFRFDLNIDHMTRMLANMFNGFCNGTGKSDVVIFYHRTIIKTETMVMSATAADRKSTRLNSSHVSISYAVFCSRVPLYIPSFPTRRSSDLTRFNSFDDLFFCFRFDLNIDHMTRMLANMFNGFCNGTGKSDVVIFYHRTIIKTETMVMSATA